MSDEEIIEVISRKRFSEAIGRRPEGKGQGTLSFR